MGLSSEHSKENWSFIAGAEWRSVDGKFLK